MGGGGRGVERPGGTGPALLPIIAALLLGPAIEISETTAVQQPLELYSVLQQQISGPGQSVSPGKIRDRKDDSSNSSYGDQ